MSALRKALAALFLVFATVAFALTPGERIVLFSGIHPVWQANFLGASSLPAGLTFSRSTTATYFNSSGVLSTAAINAPRFDYDPSTLAPRGLLVEEARTNLILQSGNLSTSPWASYTSGGGTVAISGNSVVSPDGTTTAAKITINRTTAVSDYAEYYQNVTGTAATYTASYYIKADGVGDVGKIIAIALYNGSSVVATTQVTLTSTWTRYTVSGTLAASALCNTSIGYLAGVSSQTGSISFDVWGGQAELGSFPTSYIPTTASTVQRTADVITFSGVPLAALQGAQGSAVVEFDLEGLTSAANAMPLGSAVHGVVMYRAGNGSFGADQSYVQGWVTTGSIASTNTTYRGGVSFKNGAQALSLNGGTPATSAYAFAPYVVGYNLGSDATPAQYLNGHVRSLGIYNQYLPPPTLKARSVVGAPY